MAVDDLELQEYLIVKPHEDARHVEEIQQSVPRWNKIFVFLSTVISLFFVLCQTDSVSPYISGLRFWRNAQDKFSTLWSVAIEEARDPYNIQETLRYGPYRLSSAINGTLRAGSKVDFTIECLYPDIEICPPVYRIDWVGPSRISLPRLYKDIEESTDGWVVKYKNIEVPQDPGMYQLYFFPEFDRCQETLDLLGRKSPLYNTVVQGVPLDIYVSGPPLAMHNTTCTTTNEIQNGRWVRNGIGSTMQKSNTTYVYTPYSCNLRHMTARTAIERVSNFKHLLVIGDSTSRGPFCTKINKELYGELSGDCVPGTFAHGNKKYDWVHPETKEVSQFSLIFAKDDLNQTMKDIDGLRSAPTHIMLNLGLWFAYDTPDKLKNNYNIILQYLAAKWPGVHVVLRSTGSTVGRVNGCKGEVNYLYPGVAAPWYSQDFRLGGAVKAEKVKELADEWSQKPDKTIKVSFVDAYALSDNRPDCTAEGRHWVYEINMPGDLDARPYIGESEEAVMDWVWDDFITARDSPM